MNSNFYDEDLPPDASRTFRPAPRLPIREPARRRDLSALKLIFSIVLIAAGCALLITAGCPPTVSP